MEKTAGKASKLKTGIILLIAGISFCLLGVAMSSVPNPNYKYSAIQYLQFAKIVIKKGEKIFSHSTYDPIATARLETAQERYQAELERYQALQARLQAAGDRSRFKAELDLMYAESHFRNAESELRSARLDQKASIRTFYEDKGRVEIPFKYILVVGIALSAIGVGLILVQGGGVGFLNRESLGRKKVETGAPLPEDLDGTSVSDTSSTPLAQTPPRVTEQDFSDFIGINANEYLPKFKKFNSGDSSVTWHWPAFLLSFWWMLYRKLYLWALVLSILYIVPGLFSFFLGVLYIVSGLSSNVLFWLGVLLTNILFGMFGNYIYYKHAKKKIIELKSKVKFADTSDPSTVLQRAGGVNRWVRVVVIIVLVIILLGICAAILIPQITTYKKTSSNLKERSGRHEKPLARTLSPTEQKLSQQRLAAYEVEYQKLKAENPHKDPYVLEQGMQVIREQPIAPYNYPTIEDLERLGRERIRKAAQKSNEYKGEGCIEGDCEDGHGTYFFSDGSKYEGKHKEGKKHGHGTYTFYDGRKYVGEWKNDEYLGPYTLSDGRRYFGQWKNNAPNGKGTMHYPDGRKYVGEWKNGKHHGQGTMTNPGVGKYEGEWKDGVINGQGIFTTPDKFSYIGEFKNDKYHGHGTCTHPDGTKYVGEFKDGKYHGQGTMTYPDGRKHVGEWKNDEYQG